MRYLTWSRDTPEDTGQNNDMFSVIFFKFTFDSRVKVAWEIL